jgi:hypothetical protein
MPLVTLARPRRDEEPAALVRLVLDPAGYPKTSLRWAIALAATASFATAFAAGANGPRSEPAIAPAATTRVAVLAAPDGTPATGALRRAAALPALAHAPRKHHKRAVDAHTAPAVPAATPVGMRVATPVPTRAPVAPAVPARPRTSRGAVFDTTG